jgi:hypothetical protein
MTALFVFFCLSPARGGPQVVLPEDEFILPPLFGRLEAVPGAPPDGFNVDSQEGKKRHAVAGEWFDYGDSLDVPGGQSFQVLQSETLAWVGGGVFQGKIGKYRLSDSSVVQYSLDIKRGWVRVWMKPSKIDALLKIEANGDTFTVQDAEFWLNVRSGVTEIYLVRGSVFSAANQRAYQDRQFILFPKDPTAPKKVSSEWDPKAIEVFIASRYPALVKLAELTETDWQKERIAETFRTFRKKGWRKSFRFTPIQQKLNLPTRQK